MARIPAHQVAAKAKPYGRQGIWDYILAHPKAFTRSDIAAATDIPDKTIRDYLDALLAAGFIQPVTCEARNVFVVIRSTGGEAPRIGKDGKPVTQGLGREQMWRTMKMLFAGATFDFRELAHEASTASVAVAEANAQDYVRHLHRAGYLRMVAKDTRLFPARYCLIKNTGARPPMIQRLKTVFDPNLNEIVWHEPPKDDAP